MIPLDNPKQLANLIRLCLSIYSLQIHELPDCGMHKYVMAPFSPR